MDFAKQFTEAAQKAVLTAVENGSWVNYPWMENMIKGAAREGLKPQISVDMNAIVPDFKRDVVLTGAEFAREAHGPVSNWGCSFGKCTCTDQMRAARRFTDPASPTGDKSVTSVVSRDDDGAVTVHSVSETGKDSFESNDFTHVDGYDYRIIVTDRAKNHYNSWAEHFKQKPTQEEFEYQFRHFHARTHHVHVNHWVDGDWETITTEYVPHWNKEKPKETLKPSEEWPEGKKFRIKFWDQRIDGFNYVYFDSKPGGIVLNKYHAAKCFAVTEQRPEGV